MTNELYYYKEDALRRAESLANGSKVVNGTADSSCNYSYMDDKASELQWSGETNAYIVGDYRIAYYCDHRKELDEYFCNVDEDSATAVAELKNKIEELKELAKQADEVEIFVSKSEVFTGEENQLMKGDDYYRTSVRDIIEDYKIDFNNRHDICASLMGEKEYEDMFDLVDISFAEWVGKYAKVLVIVLPCGTELR